MCQTVKKPYCVMLTFSRTRKLFETYDNYSDAFLFCKSNDWVWTDENGFVWELEIDFEEG